MILHIIATFYWKNSAETAWAEWKPQKLLAEWQQVETYWKITSNLAHEQIALQYNQSDEDTE